MAREWTGFWPARLTGRFFPSAVLGLGGRSTVVEAKSRNGEAVAVKLPVTQRRGMMRKEIRRILALEGKMLSLVASDSVVRLLEAGPAGEYLMLELLPNRSLADRWRNSSPPVPTALACAARLAEALHELHRTGVVHLDVKPRNILLRSDGVPHPVLIDLGSARPISKPVGAGTVASHKLGSGKYRFNAPEQIVRRTSHFTPQTDAFALGATLHWLLTGISAFSNATTDPSALSYAYGAELEGVFARCHALELPGTVTSLLGRLLSFEMDKRPADMCEVANILAREII